MNAPREALTRAINKAIAAGAPVYVEHNPAVGYAMRWRVTRDVRYGEVYARIYRDVADAEHCLASWPREGIEHRHPSIRLLGEFTLRPVMCELRASGSEHEVSIY